MRPSWAIVLALAALASAGCRTAAPLEKGPAVVIPLSPAVLEAAHKPRRLALVVGIQRLDDDSWRPLQYAENDAREVAHAFGEASRGRFDEVKLAIGAEATTRAGLLKALGDLVRTAPLPEDEVVVYISAHGTLARDSRGALRRYVVTSDARFDDVRNTALGVEDLRAAFDGIPSRRKLLVLATCHSGSGKSLLPGEMERELTGLKNAFYAKPLEDVSRATIVLSASEWGEPAREDPALENDVYTFFMLEGLKGPGDRNEDGAVTATEAHDYARRKTYAFTGGKQRPAAEIFETGADSIILAGEMTRIGRPELYSYAAQLDGAALSVDGVARAELPGGAAVAAGRRRVELTKDGLTLYRGDVTVAQGQRVDIEELIQASRPSRTLALQAGGWMMLGGAARNEVAPPMGGVGLSFRAEGLPGPRLAVMADLLTSAGRYDVQVLGSLVPARFVAVEAGLAVPYAWSGERYRLLVGPRLGALYFSRTFDVDLYRESQQVFSASPGLVALFAYLPTERWEVSARAHASMMLLSVDDARTVEGVATLTFGAGYRF